MGTLMRIAVGIVIGLLLGTASATAQPTAEPDTVRLVRIGDSLRVLSDTTTIFHPGAVVVGGRVAHRTSANTVQRIRLAAIERSDASSVADVASLIPSAHLQTNSRGETLLYLRNSGERQLAVYFDGAQLNVPWDNRVDLDLIPTSALASISVSKGAASSEFGSNVMGGAVNLITRDLTNPGRFTEATLHLGSGDERQVEAMHMGRTSSLSYLAAAGYVEREGITLPDDAELPYSQSDPDLRTNTDLKRFNAFARGEYLFDSGYVVSLAALAIDAEKGIAPEGHRNPDEGGVRFWRYPDWKNRMLIATFGRPTNDSGRLSHRASVWLNSFEQRIVAYESASYEARSEQEKDDDLTFGGRFILAGDFDDLGVRVSIGGSHARHDQVDTEFTPRELNLPDRIGPKQTFRQLLLNGGVEADYRSGATVYSAGINVDSRSVLEADVFDEPDAQAEVGFRAGLAHRLTGSFEIRASAGRRSRFPTLREQFSGALGRFVLNPDLASEEAFLAESSISYDRENVHLEATGFLTLTSDAIDQTVVQIEGESKRMRVNLDGSRNYGLEINASYRASSRIRVSADATVSRLRAEGETGKYDRPITERPENSGAVRLDYTDLSGVSASFEARYTGSAYSQDEDGSFVALDASTVLNARGAYRLMFTSSTQTSAELFVRLKNIADVVIENQLGLPGQGRTLIAGVKLSV
jgi:iron complex outermembrane receptor protein